MAARTILITRMHRNGYTQGVGETDESPKPDDIVYEHDIVTIEPQSQSIRKRGPFITTPYYL